MILLALAVPASAAEMVPADRIDLIASLKNLQNAIAETVTDRDRLRAENAALESRLETAMEWLKAAQQPK